MPQISTHPRRVLSPNEAAEYTGLAKVTLAKMRWLGNGPSFVKLTSRKIGYRLEDLDAFLDALPRLRSTSDTPQAA